MAQEEKQLLLNNMKTPDKLFVSCDSFGFISAYYIENHPPFGEEYIRKDALLEWANIMKRICKGAEPIEKTYQTMIDKIESL